MGYSYRGVFLSMVRNTRQYSSYRSFELNKHRFSIEKPTMVKLESNISNLEQTKSDTNCFHTLPHSQNFNQIDWLAIWLAYLITYIMTDWLTECLMDWLITYFVSFLIHLLIPYYLLTSNAKCQLSNNTNEDITNIISSLVTTSNVILLHLLLKFASWYSC